MSSKRERIGILVQARMRSTRLPGKVLLPIGDDPLLLRLCNRVGASREAQELVVAASDDPLDDVIEEACRRWGVPVFRGPEVDLLARLGGAAEVYGFTAFVRVTADNPFTDPVGIDELIGSYRETGADLVHNKHRRGYPFGTGAELVSTRALKQCAIPSGDSESREEFISWMRMNADRFSCLSLAAPAALVRPHYFLTVDYHEDLDMVTQIYQWFAMRDDVPLSDVIGYLDDHPEVASLNKRLHVPFDE